MRQMEIREKQRLLEYSYFKENMFKTKHGGYFEMFKKMSYLLERIPDSRTQVSVFMTMLGYGPLVPQLNFPTFYGSPSDWLQFEDLFDSIVISKSNLCCNCLVQH